MSRNISEKYFLEAKKILAGGVNSPVRAYRGFAFAPPYIARAKGSRIWDVDGNEYIDYVGSWGPMILGHADPDVVAVICAAAEKGTSYGAPTEAETKLAELVKEAFPSIDLVRFVSSGTEAAMSAIRLARGFTGKDKIIKFEGCYHGHADYLLVKAGSGLLTHGTPDSKGVPADFTKHTLIAKYNDLESVKALVKKYSAETAAIIVEPVAGNMGCVPPEDGFLKGLRDICDRHDIILIFDEVITGFRVAFGGAQELYGIRADLTCLGKILGGGLPVGAYGGKRAIMEHLSPLGGVYQAGTLSGNPLATAAGIATLQRLKPEAGGRKQDIYSKLDHMTADLTDGLSKILFEKDIKHEIYRVGSMFSIFFENSDDFNRYFIHMLNSGVYFAPSRFESAFVSAAHTEEDVNRTIDILKAIPVKAGI